MLPFSSDNVTAALYIWQRSREGGIWGGGGLVGEGDIYLGYIF